MFHGLKRRNIIIQRIGKSNLVFRHCPLACIIVAGSPISSCQAYGNMIQPGRTRQTKPLPILVRSKPIEKLQILHDQSRLSAEQVATWKKQLKTALYRLEASAQAWKPYTSAEKMAGNGNKVLTQDDPVPQTLYYVPAKPADPLMVEVPLRISK